MYEYKREDAIRCAEHLGIPSKIYGDRILFKYCPYCKGKEKDKNTFSIDLNTGMFHCFRASCGLKGNMITLARDFDFSLGREVDEYYKVRIHKARYGKWIPKPQKGLPFEYLGKRGLSNETIKVYGIGTSKDNNKHLIFPFIDENNNVQMYKVRNTEPGTGSKEWSDSGAYTILFGMHLCDPEDKRLVITEGQIDSMSVYEAGIKNAVSVPTGKNGFTWFPHCYDFLTCYKEIIVFGDCERDEVTLYEDIKKRCSKKWNVKCVRREDYKGCKDANELLQKYGKEAVAAAVENAVEERNKRIIPMSLVKDESLEDKEKVFTSFGALNSLLKGLFLGQVGLFTGQRGNGKSTLVSQITLDALRDYPVFMYSAELPNWQIKNWISRQLVGKEYVELDAGGDYKVKEGCLNRVNDYFERKGLYLYDADLLDESEEEDSLLDLMLECLNKYGCKVFVIDNLMTAISDDSQADLYRQQSKFMKSIKLFAKANNCLVLLVAHPRKNDSRNLTNDDVAGSSNITNLVDFVINFSKPPEQTSEELMEDMTNVRIIHLLKNRATGSLTKECGIKVYYEPESRRLSSTGNFSQIDYGVMSNDGWQTEFNNLEIPFEV